LHELYQVGLENGLVVTHGFWLSRESFSEVSIDIIITAMVVDAEAIEHEHPLVYLELIDIELAHQLNDFDCLQLDAQISLVLRVIED